MRPAAVTPSRSLPYAACASFARAPPMPTGVEGSTSSRPPGKPSRPAAAFFSPPFWAGRAGEDVRGAPRQEAVRDSLHELDRTAKEPRTVAAHPAPIEDGLRETPDRVAVESDGQRDDQDARPAVARKRVERALRIRRLAADAGGESDREYADEAEADPLRREADASGGGDPRAPSRAMRLREDAHGPSTAPTAKRLLAVSAARGACSRRRRAQPCSRHRRRCRFRAR